MISAYCHIICNYLSLPTTPSSHLLPSLSSSYSAAWYIINRSFLSFFLSIIQNVANECVCCSIFNFIRFFFGVLLVYILQLNFECGCCCCFSWMYVIKYSLNQWYFDARMRQMMMLIVFFFCYFRHRRRHFDLIFLQLSSPLQPHTRISFRKFQIFN